MIPALIRFFVSRIVFFHTAEQRRLHCPVDMICEDGDIATSIRRAVQGMLELRAAFDHAVGRTEPTFSPPHSDGR